MSIIFVSVVRNSMTKLSDKISNPYLDLMTDFLKEIDIIVFFVRVCICGKLKEGNFLFDCVISIFILNFEYFPK